MTRRSVGTHKQKRKYLYPPTETPQRRHRIILAKKDSFEEAQDHLNTLREENAKYSEVNMQIRRMSNCFAVVARPLIKKEVK